MGTAWCPLSNKNLKIRFIWSRSKGIDNILQMVINWQWYEVKFYSKTIVVFDFMGKYIFQGCAFVGKKLLFCWKNSWKKMWGQIWEDWGTFFGNKFSQKHSEHGHQIQGIKTSVWHTTPCNGLPDEWVTKICQWFLTGDSFFKKICFFTSYFNGKININFPQKAQTN